MNSKKLWLDCQTKSTNICVIWYLPMFVDKVTAVSDNPTMRIQVRNVKTVLLASLSATQWWWLLPTSPFQWQETGDCISKGRCRKFQCQWQEIGDCIYERSNVNIRKLEIVKDDAASNASSGSSSIFYKGLPIICRYFIFFMLTHFL